MWRSWQTVAIAIALGTVAAHAAAGGGDQYENDSEWIAVVGEHARVDFDDLPSGTWLTTQYQEEYGIVFTTCSPTLLTEDRDLYWFDGYGIRSFFTTCIVLSEPVFEIAVHYGSILELVVLGEDNAVLVNDRFDGLPGEDPPHFVGIIVDEPITGIIMTGLDGSQVYLDTLFFGPTIDPCPEDLDDSGVIDEADLLLLLGEWGQAGAGDLDGSGITDARDLLLLLQAWGSC